MKEKRKKNKCQELAKKYLKMLVLEMQYADLTEEEHKEIMENLLIYFQEFDSAIQALHSEEVCNGTFEQTFNKK